MPDDVWMKNSAVAEFYALVVNRALADTPLCAAGARSFELNLFPSMLGVGVGENLVDWPRSCRPRAVKPSQKHRLAGQSFESSNLIDALRS